MTKSTKTIGCILTMLVFLQVVSTPFSTVYVTLLGAAVAALAVGGKNG